VNAKSSSFGERSVGRSSDAWERECCTLERSEAATAIRARWAEGVSAEKGVSGEPTAASSAEKAEMTGSCGAARATDGESLWATTECVERGTESLARQ
jgi:hypothetical protein